MDSHVRSQLELYARLFLVMIEHNFHSLYAARVLKAEIAQPANWNKFLKLLDTVNIVGNEMSAQTMRQPEWLECLPTWANLSVVCDYPLPEVADAWGRVKVLNQASQRVAQLMLNVTNAPHLTVADKIPQIVGPLNWESFANLFLWHTYEQVFYMLLAEQMRYPPKENRLVVRSMAELAIMARLQGRLKEEWLWQSLLPPRLGWITTQQVQGIHKNAVDKGLLVNV